MNDAGYILLYRTLLGHPAFRNDGEAMTFAWMVLRAAWRPVRVRYKGQSIALERGQLAVSIRDLSDSMDRQKGWVERLLKRMRSEKMIETHAETGATIITICNYDEYQPIPEGDRTPSATLNGTPAGTVDGTANGTPAGQAQDTEQRREEFKKEEIGGKPPISARRAADPFPKPDFADDQHWRDFLLNRKHKRLPNTATAYAKLLRDIARISTDEWPPGRLIEHAAAKGWGGIYDPNGDTQNGTRQPAIQPGPGSLRGSRPDPSLDLLRAARAAGSSGDSGDRSEVGATVPSLWPG